jgi:putative flippase GtrA
MKIYAEVPYAQAIAWKVSVIKPYVSVDRIVFFKVMPSF